MAFGVWRSAFGDWTHRISIYNIIFESYYIPMNDFTEFEAFQLCRDFARAIAVPLKWGVFSRDPVLVTQLRKTIISIYSNFADGFERDGNREFSQFVSVSKGIYG